MIRLLVVAMVMAAACSGEGVAPPVFNPDEAGVAQDGGADLSMQLPVDMTPAGDMEPQACVTACDCPSGQRCRMRLCETSMPPVYCCGTPECTGSNVCETSTGKVSQCGNSADGGLAPDAGAASCTSIGCIKGIGSGAYCTVVCGVTATCKDSTTGGSPHCAP